MDERAFITGQAEAIRSSGALGRSKSYARLFDFLVECTLSGRTPKEIEIASEVFARDSSFDPSQDSMVRVYAHNLRQKLRQYYDSSGADQSRRLTIPRGEYRLAIDATDSEAPDPAPNGARGQRTAARRPIVATMAIAGLALVAVGTMLGQWLADRDGEPGTIASSPLWNEILNDDLPVLVVVGDYYIFGELDEYDTVSRFVREFSVNSAEDLEAFEARQGNDADRYRDLDVWYLASSSAPALANVFSVLYTADKPVDVVPMSQFDPGDLRTNHVVYVGYISALDKLLDFVFASSTLAIGQTYDELWNMDTGEIFHSSAGLPADTRNYRDYGFISTFPGPAGNQFLVISGTRDEGVMHVARLASDPSYVGRLEDALPEGAASQSPAFELLYEVTGFDRTSIDSMLVHAAELHYHDIWLGEHAPSSR